MENKDDLKDRKKRGRWKSKDKKFIDEEAYQGILSHRSRARVGRTYKRTQNASQSKNQIDKTEAKKLELLIKLVLHF